MRRRDFIRTIGATGVGVATGLGITPFDRVRYASAAPTWGDYPSYAKDAELPNEKRAKNVLELFLYGGLCPWETFYVVDNPAWGEKDKLMWYTFLTGTDSIPNVYTNCYGAEAPPMLTDFRVDENGVLVKLGPFAQGLRKRQDIVDRLRVHVVSHTLEPHEGAIPLAMSGYRLGAPKLAGVGAAVQHYHLAHATEITGEPYAYVLYSPGDFPTDNLRAASSVGQHPGSSRPLSIKVTASTAFIDALKRKEVGALRPQFDALLSNHLADYKKRLTWPGQDAMVRSLTVNDYASALGNVQKTDTLIEILKEEFFKGVSGSACGQTSNPNYPHMGLKLASHILTRPGSLARHVTVVDGGLIPASGGGGYDTHTNHIKDSARNLANIWHELTSIINEPGENNPAKLNLEETLIVVNTEFGRTPWNQNGSGRNHHPYAYVTLMFGGPVGPDQQGIVGSIGSDGFAVNALSPAESRAATLAALGVYPFAPECYAVSDVYGAGTELEASMWINEVVLGVKA